MSRADSALAAGNLQLAAAAVETALRQSPRDPDVWIAAGRVELERPWARFRALERFRRASALAPDGLEPWYWIARTGVTLGGDDGEAIARPALERILAAQPTYRDVWEVWLSLYRDDSHRAAMARRLAPHSRDPEIASRIAHLNLEAGATRAADSIFADLQRSGRDPRWSQGRAIAAFLDGHDSLGLLHYAGALRLSWADSNDVLWDAVVGIAAPRERAAYASAAPARRPTFYEDFWAYRDPDLVTPENERIPEHFRRRAEARRRYGLLHPLSRFHVSRPYWAFVSLVSGRGPREVEVREDVLPLGVNLVDRVDDRGLILLRHGEPDRVSGSPGGEEWWFYDAPPSFTVRFDLPNPSEAPIGDVLFDPVDAATTRGVVVAMASDRTAYPAPLEFGYWLARFRDREDPEIDIAYLFVDSLSAAAALFDGAGRLRDRARGAPGAPVVLIAAPGEYLLGVDARSGDRAGRHRAWIELPDYGDAGVALSDLIVSDVPGPLAPAAPTSRDAAVRHARGGLRLRADRPFAIYAEVYGAATDDAGLAHYEVSYRLERRRSFLSRLFGADPGLELRFERRVVPDRELIEETLRIDPRDVRPGVYELSVQVRDLVAGGVAETASVRLRVLDP